MNISAKFRLALLPATIALLSTDAVAASAQGIEMPRPLVEEVVVVGRLKTGATDVIVERLEQEVVVDLLSAEDITRVGDSDVAAALRRVPGLTLVNNQFIYVRGLGERYSSTLLNGAQVPSPDLTRNVIPLDIFPTAILDSLAVQKGYSADMPAGFGGGNINIRTKNIPTGPTLMIQAGGGWNFSSDDVIENSNIDDDLLGRASGSQKLPATVEAAIDTYRGSLSPTTILQTLQFDGGTHSIAEAQAINRQLAAQFDRGLSIGDADADPDLNLQMAAGNRYYFGKGDAWEVGGLLVGAYSNQWRNRDRVNRAAADPDRLFFETSRTVKEVSATGFAEGGLSWNDEQNLRVSYMYLRNTENEATLGTGFNVNNLREDGEQLRVFGSRFEQRDLEVLQFGGEHEIGGATLDLVKDVSGLDLALLEGLRFEWYYSDSESTTDIPNEVSIQAEDDIDPVTGEVFNTEINRSTSAMDLRFTDLADQVESWGWDVIMPFYASNYDLELSAGYDYSTKGRDYDLTQFFLGTNAFTPVLLTPPAQAFGDASILDPANGFSVDVGGIGTESYLAGQIIDGAYGKFDFTWQGTWRFSAGLRWEQFQQASVAIDRNQYNPAIGQVVLPPGTTLEDVVFLDDDYYPSASLTWIQTQRFGAEDFQLRFGWSQTVTRPDLREISDSVFIDPLTEARVRGQPGLKPAELTNYDARAEWFFANGDTMTISLFYKDISEPIETVFDAGTDDNVVLTFTNTERGELYGLEFEWLKDLSFAGRWVGDWVDGFFLQGNITLSDSEMTLGDIAQNLTNDKRRLTQHSQWVVNTQLGYDSPDGLHSVSLVFNSFGERIFSAGRNGAEDSYEQPFNSLDLVWSYYPTDSLTLRARVQNMLADEREIQQIGARIFEQEVGTSATLQLRWEL